jgi:hypothetical protein
MATSTLIQYLETERYGSLPGAGTEAVGEDSMNRRQVETFIAAAAILAGQTVSLDASQTADGDKAIKVKPSDTGNTDLVCPVGVALAAAAIGEKVEVCVRGVCKAGAAAHAKGDVLTVTGTAGVLDTTAAATSPAVAISLDGATPVATVFVRGAF